jgi:phage shock protein PspC (stress-responsive transcriptional regulator)
VTAADVDDVLREVGPVDGGASNWGSPSPAGTPGIASAPRRLFRVRDGAMIAGLCNGIAAHFNIDPTLVRVAFVLAAIVEIAAFDRPPAGVVGLYAILVFIVPDATPVPDGTQGMPGSFVDRVRLRVERVRTALFGGAHHNARSGEAGRAGTS